MKSPQIPSEIHVNSGTRPSDFGYLGQQWFQMQENFAKKVEAEFDKMIAKATLP